MDKIEIAQERAKLPLRDLIRAIDLCIDEELFIPGLILLYSAIDIMAWIDSSDSRARAGRDVFVNWVEKYLLKDTEMPCSALDLYGARCSIVHTLSPESDLSRQGRVKEITYVARAKPDDNLEKRITGPSNTAILSVERLVTAFRIAALRFLRDVLNDPEKRNRMEDLYFGFPASKMKGNKNK